jgi:phage tail sheath gpL-like
MGGCNNIYITDCNGGKHFNVIASPMSTDSEIKNLRTHLSQAKSNPEFYKFIDAQTAFIVLNGKPI